ncbi:hypothetical protein [Marinobacterium litorale]|uniref:hypothetical protein n=1 Tax=Marinobacterium litorale TaxID=404770 RepID=UPI000405A0AD|nr:hypothetical protein [Marinobacterium litorale]
MGFWVPFLLTVGLMAASFLLVPKPKQPNPAAAEEFDIPTAQEGKSIPVLFGTRVIKGASVVWYGDIKTKAIKKKSGKK